MCICPTSIDDGLDIMEASEGSIHGQLAVLALNSHWLTVAEQLLHIRTSVSNSTELTPLSSNILFLWLAFCPAPLTADFDYAILKYRYESSRFALFWMPALES